MISKLLIATRNEGKLKEFKNFLSDLPIEIQSLDDLNIREEVEENENSYKKNSQKKATFYANLTNVPTIADDGGIEIEALGGEPGIKSKRWLGEDSTEDQIIKHMIKISKELKDNRKAFFKTVVSFAIPARNVSQSSSCMAGGPKGKIWSASGEVEGIISKKPYLEILKGYPYRSFFYLPKLKKFYHEDQLTREEEKLYNHRYKAVKKLTPIIKRELRLI